MVLFAFILFYSATSYSQYDLNTQPIRNTLITGSQTQATSYIGQFIVNQNNDKVYLLGSTGNIISTVGPFQSSANISVATNHDTYLAVVTAGLINNEHDPEIRVYVYNNLSISLGNPGNGGMSMMFPKVLMPNTPNVNQHVRTGIPPHTPHDAIHWIETCMDNQYLYIAWQLNSRRLGFAIMNLNTKQWAVSPSNIPEPFPGSRNAAQGSIPTVSCYRWSQNQVHIAYVADQGIQPYDFQPSIPFHFNNDPIITLPKVNTGTQQNPINHDIQWVRVICFDHFSSANGEHYFYGTKSILPGGGNDPLLHELWTTNGTNQPIGPHSTTLVNDPINDDNGYNGFANPVPPMSTADPYQLWINLGNSSQSVFFIYKEWATYLPGINPNPTVGTVRLNICRQDGSNILTLFTHTQQALSNPNIVFQTNARGSIQYDGSILNNSNGIQWRFQGNMNSNDTTENYRALFYINAPLLLSANSTLFSEKGQIRFINASSQAAIAKLTVTGANSSILLNWSTVIFGSTSTSTPLSQIEMNLGSTTNNNQSLHITNSLLTTGWQSNLPYNYQPTTAPQGYRSDIFVNRASSVNVTNNIFLYTFIQVDNPQGNVVFNQNKISSARNALTMRWTTTGQFNNTITTRFNRIYEVWPIGITQDDPIDFTFSYLVGAQQQDVRISENIFECRYGSNGLRIIQPNHTGIDFIGGSVGRIMDNTIRGRTIGIHTEATNNTNPFICLNDIDGTGTFYGIGLKQDGSGNGNQSYVKLNTIKRFNVSYMSSGHDQSVLVNNYLEDSWVGAQFLDHSQATLNGYYIGNTTTHVKGQNRIRHNSEAQIVIGDEAQPEIGAPTVVPQQDLVD
jgi:hypothetical protein